jgi:hypothetical protein
MRLPDSESWEAEEEVLAYSPGLVFVVKFHADYSTVFVVEVVDY